MAKIEYVRGINTVRRWYRECREEAVRHLASSLGILLAEVYALYFSCIVQCLVNIISIYLAAEIGKSSGPDGDPSSV